MNRVKQRKKTRRIVFIAAAIGAKEKETFIHRTKNERPNVANENTQRRTTECVVRRAKKNASNYFVFCRYCCILSAGLGCFVPSVCVCVYGCVVVCRCSLEPNLLVRSGGCCSWLMCSMCVCVCVCIY